MQDFKKHLVSTEGRIHFCIQVFEQADDFFDQGKVQYIDVAFAVKQDAPAFQELSQFFPVFVFLVNDSNFLWLNATVYKGFNFMGDADHFLPCISPCLDDGQLCTVFKGGFSCNKGFVQALYMADQALVVFIDQGFGNIQDGLY